MTVAMQLTFIIICIINDSDDTNTEYCLGLISNYGIRFLMNEYYTLVMAKCMHSEMKLPENTGCRSLFLC